MYKSMQVHLAISRGLTTAPVQAPGLKPHIARYAAHGKDHTSWCPALKNGIVPVLVPGT
jgi:hypothetical protein